jgi:hypothetical protein
MQVSSRYIIAFLLLLLLIQEAHELSHFFTGLLVGGCGGTRYFLYWLLCETGPTGAVVITAFAGPFINYLFMWIGYALLRKPASMQQKSWGFTFIMAALPLARIQAIVFRGGDEILAFHKMSDPGPPFKGFAVIMGSLLILLLTLPPLWKAFKSTVNLKNRWLLFISFLLGPLLFDIALQQLVMKTGLKTALLLSPGLFGIPSWLAVVDFVLLLSFMLIRKRISSLFRQA